MPTATSLPFVCYNGTIKKLQEMARKKVFTSKGFDKMPPVLEKSVVGRLGRNDPAFDGPERGFDLPGFTVTYMGMKGSPSQGTLCHDDRVIRILIQLVDRTDQGSSTNTETYFAWMTHVREWIQTNPYARDDANLGHVFLVHVTDESLPDEEKWAIDREMRMYTVVNCFARMRRTKDQELWQST
jgi:hypothetical protein